jgi:hypothetical protein
MKKLFLIAMGLFWIPVVWADLNDGLVAYYPFDGNANDESGNGNHGTVHGATLTEDRFGNADSAYHFDGVYDYIEIKNTEIMNPNYITISVWYFIDKSFSGDGSNVIIHKPYTSHVTPYYQWHIGVTGDQYHNTNSKIIGAISNPNGTLLFTEYKFPNKFIGVWHYLAMSFDGSVLKFYLNGKLTSLKKTDSDFVIGSYPTNIFIGKQGNLNNQRDYTPGIIDDIRIYNRALSESEIQQLYQINNQSVEPSSDDCWATYENGKLHIPCIKLKGAVGEELHYEADMQYKPLSKPMSFQVTGAKPK